MTPYRFTHLLVPVDGSEGADKALDCALSLCELVGASLTALAVEGKLPAYAASVGEVEEVKREKDDFFERVLERTKAEAGKRGMNISTDLIPGHAAEVITQYAKANGCDLIVIGHRGHFLGDYLLGSTADRVTHHAHCPVMVVR
jgi:nucleotide-binding universal stress UspA family protein